MTAGAGGIPRTWTYFTAFPIHFLGVVTGILLGARDLLAVLDTVPARAQDAGQEAVEPEDGVPHFPVGVGLPVVNASWRRQREEPDAPGSKSSSSWHAQGLLELATFHNLPNSSAHQQHTPGQGGRGDVAATPTRRCPRTRGRGSRRWRWMGPRTPGEVRGSCGQDLTCLLASVSPGSLQGHRQPQAQQRVPPADFSMQIFGGPKAFLQGFISKGWKEPFWRHSGGRAPRGEKEPAFLPFGSVWFSLHLAFLLSPPGG